MLYNGHERKMRRQPTEGFCSFQTDRISFRVQFHRLLTEFHADVLIRILLPEFLILIFVTHERENDFLTDGLGETTCFSSVSVDVKTAILHKTSSL